MPKVFVSHVHEEGAVGSVVKTWTEDVFGSHDVKAFLSSDRGDLQAGEKWLEVISKELSEARVIVSVLSPRSIRRPWVNIELGAGWIKGLAVIPLCHSGLKFGSLSQPFGAFSGVGLDMADAAERLLGGIAKGLELRLPTRLSFDACGKELLAAAAKSTGDASVPSDKTYAANPLDLTADQLVILRYLATIKEHGGDDDVPSRQIAQQVGLTFNIVEIVVEELKEQNLVRMLLNMNTGASYYISTDGLRILNKLGQLP